MNITTNDLVLRAEQPTDEEFLQQLFEDVHAPAFLPLGLPADRLQSLLKMQWQAQRMGYAHQFPAREPLIVELVGNPVGRLLIERGPHTIHLVDVAILSSMCGRGIGTWLLEQLSQQADTRQQTIHLSVRPENRALSLYRRFGFFLVENTQTDLKMKRLPLSVVGPACKLPSQS